VLTRARARSLGYTDRAITRAVESGRWRSLLPRTFFTGHDLTARDRCEAAVQFAGDGAALSGASALQIAGVSGVRSTPRLLILVPPGNRARSRAFVHVRETRRSFRIHYGPGPRHVEPARACADLALATRCLDDARGLLAKVVQGGWATVGELAVELEAGPRQGSALFRQALAEIGYGAASAPEAHAATLLRRAGITDFVQNVVLDVAPGVRWIADLYWERLRAILEIDSVQYHFGGADWTRTMDRDLSLTTHGYSVIHRPPSALRDGTCFVAEVRAWLRGRELELRRGIG